MIETSIIIPVRNQKSSLLLALNNLRRQIKKPRTYEIVVCDDGSLDGTRDALKKLRYPIFFKYFINNPPLGRSANRNMGFEKSSGKDIIFLDGDMVPSDGYIDAMLSDGNTDIVKLGIPRVPPGDKVNRLDRYLYSRGRYSQSFENQFLPGRLFTSNSFYISRENFNKTGGFDTRFKGWGGEDIDFGLRLEALGIQIRNFPDAVTYHYHKRDIGSLADDFYSFGTNSFDYLINKHPSFLEQIPAYFIGIHRGSSIGNILSRLVSSVLINRLLLNSLKKAAASFEDLAWPYSIYDFIAWGNLALGYRHRKKENI